MSRYSSDGSKGHHLQQVAPGWFRMSWTVDYYYADSRLRFPRRFSRDTDLAGARRFAKRWGIEIPHLRSQNLSS